MKQLDLIALPVMSKDTHATCAQCGKRKLYEMQTRRFRDMSFKKKLAPLGWSKIKSRWLCDGCLQAAFKKDGENA